MGCCAGIGWPEAQGQMGDLSAGLHSFPPPSCFLLPVFHSIFPSLSFPVVLLLSSGPVVLSFLSSVILLATHSAHSLSAAAAHAATSKASGVQESREPADILSVYKSILCNIEYI